MKYEKKEIKEGIQLHTISTNKFKTNIVAVFLTTPLNRENVTYNAVLSAVLRRGSKTMPTQEIISKELEEMYGASFNCGLDKTGDNQILKFYLESINDNFLPQNDNKMLKTSIKKLLDIVCNPLIENDSFKNEYVEQEKQNIKQLIESKKDNKAKYALERCIEEMYKEQPFGLYKYGYIEDLEKINAKNLYEYYKKLLQECKIDIFISGDIEEKINEYINKNENLKKLENRTPKFNKITIEKKKSVKEKTITESMNVTQGKLVLGLDVNIENDNQKYDALVYNAILGGTAASKLFQNVREKASLAYAASSCYLKNKSNIFISCGIEISNYEKALEIVRKQLDDMKSGNFTDEDINNAKRTIISMIKSIDDEQDTEIMNYFGQELTGNSIDLKKYIEIVNLVDKKGIVNVANKIDIDVIYFLRN